MLVVARVLVLLVAALHIWFLVLEMFLWQKPLGLKTFGQTADRAEITATLAKNQGLYNGFLAAGLVWGAFAGELLSRPVTTFFLGCVIVAGIYGAATVSRRIFFVQSLPAIAALVATWLVGRI